MRKHDWFAWAFLLVVGGLIAIKRAWFKEQYLVGAHWAIDGWHWMTAHRGTVAIGAAIFFFGLLIGWARNARLVRRLTRSLNRVAERLAAAESSTLVHQRANAELQRVVVDLQDQLRTDLRGQLRVVQNALYHPWQEPEPVLASPGPAPVSKKKAAPKKKADPKAKEEPRPWQERLLDDDLDHIDEPTPQSKGELVKYT